MSSKFVIGYNVQMYDKSGKFLGTAKKFTNRDGRATMRATWYKLAYKITDMLSRRVYGKPIKDLTMPQMEYLIEDTELGRAESKLRNSSNQEKTSTNADRIRAMSDEELAILCEDGCPPGQICQRTDFDCTKGDCIHHWLDWLQSPAKGGGGDGE